MSTKQAINPDSPTPSDHPRTRGDSGETGRPQEEKEIRSKVITNPSKSSHQSPLYGQRRSAVTVWLVHGFNAKNPEKTIGKLRPWLKTYGYKVQLFNYGWLGLLGVRFFNKRIARTLNEFIRPGDVGIGHSNGCAILRRAADMGAPFRQLVWINPALNRDTELSKQIKLCTVLHTPHDNVVRWAARLPRHEWGDMGYAGYTGDDPRYFNIMTNESGHSTIFQSTPWMRSIASWI